MNVEQILTVISVTGQKFHFFFQLFGTGYGAMEINA